MPFLQISHKQPPFYSKVHNLTVKKHFNNPGNHIRVIKLPLKEITTQPLTTALSTGIPSSQLLQNHYHEMSNKQKYDPNPQAQYLNVILKNKTKQDSITIPRGILGHIDFLEKCNVTQPQPYTPYNLNEVTKTLIIYLLSQNLINLQFMNSIKSQLTKPLP